MATAQTRAALKAAALRLVSREGVRGVTARSLAAEAGVNQALVFYHFAGVEELLREAMVEATEAVVDSYATRLNAATSFEELLEVGQRLSVESAASGQAALLSHVLAAAHADPAQAELLGHTLGRWRAAVEHAVRRLLEARGLTDSVDMTALAGTLSAATIGMITVDAIPGRPLGNTLDGLMPIARLLDRAGRVVPAPVARRLLGVLARRPPRT